MAYTSPVDEAVEFFWALGDEERLRVINLLLAHKHGACVCELVDALRLPQYQVSRQLRVLRRVGIVSSLKRGNWVYYDIRSDLPPLASWILKYLAAHLQDETASDDRDRLVRRLSLRSDGKCVIGYENDRPFRDHIPVVQIQPQSREPRSRG